MDRIVLIGCGGSGKSTLSRKISEKLNLPLYHLDKIFWNEGWVETPKDEFDEEVKNMAKQIYIAYTLIKNNNNLSYRDL